MKKQLLLILASPLLLTLGWPPLVSGLLLFFGFIPLLVLESISPKRYGLKIYLSLLLWNIGTTWWVWNASPEGCIAMLLANSFLMSLPFLVYKRIKRRFGLNPGLAAWVISWMSFEYLHLNWDLTYPWLNLGNGLAAMPKLIQWYEFTGTLGGTLWLLCLNALIFKRFIKQGSTWLVASAMIGPIAVSMGLLFFYTPQKTKPVSITIVQPNIDPYQKFESMDPESEVRYFTSMAEPKLDSSTEILVFPETAMTEFSEERYINNNLTQNALRHWLTKFPNLTLVTGANTYRFFDSSHRPATARKNNAGEYYDIYNSSLAIDRTGVKSIYRKSKLVPGVEKMPYPKLFSFLEDYAIDLGGISGSLGSDSFARVFYSKQKVGMAPLICYESVFGEYVTTFVKKGANVIFVLSNDGWWGNTPGYRQHKLYARLRAIETRREVVRCTNTGTSCHIDIFGNIHGETPWWTKAVKQYTIQPQTNFTFYVRYGDYLGRIAACLFSLVFLMCLLPLRFFPQRLKPVPVEI